jgi:hypothetical protein
MTSNRKFHNDTVSLNELWYQSHKSVIASTLIKVGMQDKMDEVCNSVLGEQHKIKQQKDPNKPKRAKSSYLYFCDDKRKTVMDDLKKKLKKGENIKIANVSKKLGDMWKKLSDKDKVKYNNLSNADKKRYESEMEEYSQ